MERVQGGMAKDTLVSKSEGKGAFFFFLSLTVKPVKNESV